MRHEQAMKCNEGLAISYRQHIEVALIIKIDEPSHNSQQCNYNKLIVSCSHPKLYNIRLITSLVMQARNMHMKDNKVSINI